MISCPRLACCFFGVAVVLLVATPPIRASVTGDLLKSLIFQIYTPNTKVVPGEQCRNLSNIYHEALQNNEEWALKMLDSSSKISPGIIQGHLADLGQFDECLSVEKTVDDTVIRGKHCYTTLRVSTASRLHSLNKISVEPSVLTSAKAFAGYNPREAPTTRATSSAAFRWSICVPDACSAEDVQSHLQYILGMTLEQSVKVSVSERYCQSIDTQPKWRPSDWTMLAFFIIIGIIIVVETVYDTYNNYYDKDSLHPLFTAFSVLQNGKQLLHVNRSREQFHCLHGIRWFSMMWVIIGHRYMFTSLMPTANGRDIRTWLTRWTSYFPIGGSVSVDTFFVMAGLLMMYLFLKTKAAGKPYNVPLLYVHRYLRLTPPLLIMLLFALTFSRFMGSGPLWPLFPSYEVEKCEKYWWSLLLYVQNYVNPTEMCLGQTWYLSADMQLFFVAPLIIIPLYKWPRITAYVLVTLIAIFIIVPLSISIAYEIPAGATKMNAKFFRIYYFPTHTRAATYLIGIALGYIMFEKKKTIVEIKPTFNILCWILSLGIMTVVVLGQYPMNQSDYVRNNIMEGFYNGFSRVAWSIALSWVIFACSFGYGGPVNWLLSLPMFQILAKLTYCMYIVHFSMLTYKTSSMKTVPYFSDLDVLYEYGGDLFFTTIVGLVWTLCFELPFSNLEIILFKGAGKRKAEQPIYIDPHPTKVTLGNIYEYNGNSGSQSRL